MKKHFQKQIIGVLSEMQNQMSNKEGIYAGQMLFNKKGGPKGRNTVQYHHGSLHQAGKQPFIIKVYFKMVAICFKGSLGQNNCMHCNTG